MFEGKGVGVQWSNFASGISVDDNFSLLLVMIFMFLLNFIHLAILYYLENVMPGDHGLARPWYFPVLCLMNRPKPVLSVQSDPMSRDADGIVTFTASLNRPDYLEDESVYQSRHVGVRIKDISKSFKQFNKDKTAVRNLSLNIYEGQITVLLGHNGAGKV
jgi:ABC-type multidrug transport system fused ATPase/permease subunit